MKAAHAEEIRRLRLDHEDTVNRIRRGYQDAERQRLEREAEKTRTESAERARIHNELLEQNKAAERELSKAWGLELENGMIID